MSKYICGLCGKVHTDGTRTLMECAKNDENLRLTVILKGKIRAPFEPWHFYFTVWRKVQ